MFGTAVFSRKFSVFLTEECLLSKHWNNRITRQAVVLIFFYDVYLIINHKTFIALGHMFLQILTLILDHTICPKTTNYAQLSYYTLYMI